MWPASSLSAIAWGGAHGVSSGSKMGGDARALSSSVLEYPAHRETNAMRRAQEEKTQDLCGVMSQKMSPSPRKR